ncbi:MAG: ABC transporter ATP-binding protein [Bacteroidota bacterium]
MIAVNNLSFSYKDKEIFSQTSFVLRPNRIYGLIGPNGVGKTTLISILAGIQSQGNASISNVKHPGLLLQGVGFYENLTVLDNLKISKFDKKSSSISIEQVLALVKMTDYHSVKYSNLSQGYKQRLGIARSLLTDGNLVLLDEPFTAVDVQTVRLLKKSILDYVASTQKTIVISSHQLKIIDDLIDQPLMIKAKKVHSFDLKETEQRDRIIYLWMDEPDRIYSVENMDEYAVLGNCIDNILEIRLLEEIELRDFIGLLQVDGVSWKRLDKEMPLEFFYFNE